MNKNKKNKQLQIQKKKQQKKQQRRKQKQMFKKMRSKMGKGDSFKLTKAYIAYYTQFQHELEFSRIKLKDVSGDGNCLFRAIGDQLDGTENTHMFLRNQACKYILMHAEFFQNFIDKDQEGTIEQYVEAMNKSGEWGGHIELQALSQCLQCVIVIHKKSLQQSVISPILSNPKGTILHLAYFQHQDFQHYLSIRDIDDFSEDPAINALKPYTKNMYRHLLEYNPYNEQQMIMQQMQQLQLNDNENGYQNEQGYEQQYQNYKAPEPKQPYPGLPANKKCKCGSNQTYKNCCLKAYHRKRAQLGY